MHSLPINAQFLHKQKQPAANELQQLQADVVMYWDCFETAAVFFWQFFFVLQELTNPTQLYVSFLCLAWCTKWLIMYEPNVAVLDTNSTGVSKTIVGFETPRKRLWNTRFVWFSCNIKLYINIQNILSVWGVFIFLILCVNWRVSTTYENRYILNSR